MTQQVINIGALPNDGTGDPLRIAFNKINYNFTELYAGAGSSGGVGVGIVLDFGTFITPSPGLDFDFGSIA